MYYTYIISENALVSIKLYQSLQLSDESGYLVVDEVDLKFA